MKKDFLDYLRHLKKIILLVPYYEPYFITTLFWGWCSSIRSDMKKSNRLYLVKKNDMILRWLDKRYGYLVPSTFSNLGMEPSNRIWVFWYQGENEKMPDVVRMCLRSIQKNAGNHEVILLDKNNISDYVALPDYIVESADLGRITLANLSDLVRVSLLYEYGGLWMDATLFASQYINTKNMNPLFDSIKIRSRHNGTISDYRWATFCLYAYKGSPAYRVFRDVMLAFFKDNNKRIIDYLLIDYTFELLYRKCFEFRRVVDNIPYRHEHLYDLIGKLNTTDSMEMVFKKWRGTYLYKLNWRPTYLNEINGEPTLFTQLRNFIYDRR